MLLLLNATTCERIKSQGNFGLKYFKQITTIYNDPNPFFCFSLFIIKYLNGNVLCHLHFQSTIPFVIYEYPSMALVMYKNLKIDDSFDWRLGAKKIRVWVVCSMITQKIMSFFCQGVVTNCDRLQKWWIKNLIHNCFHKLGSRCYVFENNFISLS